MPSFSEAVEESGRLALCALFATNEAANALISPIAGDSLGLYPLTSGLRRQLCSDDPDNDPAYVPPFTGGQCPIVYRILFNATGASNACNPIEFGDNNVGGGVGPISRRLFHNTAISDQVGGLCPGFSFNEVIVSNAAGEFVLVGQARGIRLNSFSVVPESGAPDNCGDPPPPPSIPGPITTNPPDITYNIDGDTTITVPISFTFSPAYIAIDGKINVPVNFDVGGLDFSGEVTVSPEFNFEFSPSFNRPGPGQPDDPTAIGEPGGGAEPIEDEDELPTTIIGVLVYSDIESEADPSGILFVNGPDLYVPRLASVQFAIKTANSIGWTPDQDVKNLECYVPCPAPQGAIAVRVSPMPGVQSRFTPVRGKPLTTFDP